MFKQTLFIAWRTLQRNRLISFINITGLAVGITACILIFLYVDTELHYDKSWKNSDRIYRVTEIVHLQDKIDPFALTDFNVGLELAKEYPEVEQVTRLYPAGTQTAWYEERSFDIEENYFADSTFFEVFDMEFVQGDPATALREPKTIVISDELALKIFGTEQAVGNLLKFSRNTYRVTGVIRPKAFPTHLSSIQVLLSISSMPPSLIQQQTQGFLRMSVYTYLKFRDPGAASGFTPKMQAWADKTINHWLKAVNLNGSVELRIQPVSEIHFDTYYIYDHSPKGNRKYVLIFAWVAIFLLLIACFNYMNLSTAQSLKRTREVAIRKVAGANRMELVRQFLGESLLVTGLALLIAMVLIELLLPGFNTLTENEISLSGSFGQVRIWLVLAGMLLLTGLAGGVYPALVVARQQPDHILRSASGGKLSGIGTPGRLISKLLVIAQFTISVAMITATLIVMLQMNFMKSHDLGFDREEVVVLSYPAADTSARNRMETIKAEFMKDPHIRGFATGDHIPGSATGRLLFSYNPGENNEEQAINIAFADYDYFSLLGIRLLKGRLFSRDFPGDRLGSFVINEACARFLNLDDPVGKEIANGFMRGKIVGVVHDYNYASLHKPVEPLIFMLPLSGNNTSVGGLILLKIDGSDISGTLRMIEENWKQFFPRHPVNYFFLDEEFDKQYRKEETMLRVFAWFSGLTILVSCLGLFALAFYSAQKRTKEIGIRKVLGASVRQVVTLLLKEFTGLVIISVFIATPITWYLMQGWLEDFEYRIAIPLWTFLATGIIALLIAIATVSYHALRSAVGNPVNALRYE